MIAAVAFATILAVVAGLVLSASAALAHDVVQHRAQGQGLRERGGGRRAHRGDHHRRDRDRDRHHRWKGAERLLHGGARVRRAASANFPALILALTWRRFNTTGAVTGVLLGTVSSIGLVVVGPDFGVLDDPWFELSNPGIISIPLGFLGCVVGTLLSKDERKAERNFDELYVRSETGLGAEEAEAARREPGRAPASAM